MRCGVGVASVSLLGVSVGETSDGVGGWRCGSPGIAGGSPLGTGRAGGLLMKKARGRVGTGGGRGPRAGVGETATGMFGAVGPLSDGMTV